MGVFDWPIRLESLDGERSLQLDAMVDTGSSYTIVPAHLLRSLGVVPAEKVDLTLADGRRVAWGVGEARATVDGRSTVTWVIFGEEGAGPLLGAYTLEGLRMSVDPWKHTLIPMPYGWA